ncbi:MAG: CARDB domain-containing protein, partial [Candidatus Paceibacterota bacterium]
MNKLNKKILPGIVIVFALFFCATPSKVHAQAQMFPPGTFPPGTPACVTADTNTPVNIDWSLGLPGQPYAGDKGYSNNSVQVGWGDGAGGTYALDNGSYYGSAAHMTHTWTTPGDYIFSGQGPGWGGCGQQSCSGGAVAGTMTGNTGSASGAPTVCYAIIRAPLPNLPPNVPTCLTGVPNTSYTFTYQGYNQYYDPNGTVTISFWDNGSWSPFSAPTDAAPGGGQTKTISHAWSWATPGSYLVKGEGPSGGGSSCNNSGGCTANGSSGSGPLTGPTGVQGMSLAGPQGGPSFCRVTITAGSPDLSAGSVIPSSATAGTAVTLSSTITNGPSAATGAAFTDLFQIANDSSGTGTTDIGTYANSALAANGSNSATLSYTFSSVGTSYVRACADKSSGANAGVIAESNESNNCGAWTAITVAGTPDLTGVSGSGVSITAGQTASLSGTVQNIGTGAAGSTFNNLF